MVTSGEELVESWVAPRADENPSFYRSFESGRGIVNAISSSASDRNLL
jgi:hypothetical protein